MKRILKLAAITSAVASTVAAGVVIFAPEDRLNLVVETWRGFTDRPAQACVEFVRLTAQDPDSVRLRVAAPVGDRHVYVEYTARNALGGTVREWVKCAIDGGTKVNVAETIELMRPHL